jgi:hypothetical protein
VVAIVAEKLLYIFSIIVSDAKLYDIRPIAENAVRCLFIRFSNYKENQLEKRSLKSEMYQKSSVIR